MTVEGWLQGLGLARYAKAFAEHAIDHDVLPELTEADLETLGIPLGHRKKLLKAIRNLGAQSAATVPGSPLPAVRSEAERRQLTVMFVDLVGSTELSLKLDPEELRDLLRAYQDVLGREVFRFGGHVAKYMGDGVLVYFGYPQAYEDDAVRSIYAGLAVVRAVKQLGKRALAAHGGRLRARVGIATGLVVVGDLVGAEGSEAGAVTGETPNLASRLQSLAGSGRVVVAERTRALAGEAFTYEESEEHRLKGFPEPVKLWRVLGPSGAESRFEALHGQWLTPLVGREHELALLLERWRQAKDGEGQVVLISGEAGIGKSRVTEVLRERVMADDHIRIRLQCSPYHMNSALYPIIEHLERVAGLESDDTPEVKLDKLEAMIAQATASVGETASLFAPLLSIPTGERYPPLSMTPERQKERTLAALTEQVMGLTVKAPVLMIVEDAHWIDPTTLESIDLTIARLEASRVLLVVTFRPEFQPKWLERPNVTSISLKRLSKREGAEMVDAVSGGRTLPPEVLAQVIARTDGIPLFLEELTRMVLESGLLKPEGKGFVLEGPLPPLAIPSTLQGSLMARLDRLAPAKELAQTAAAIGRIFSYDLLAAVTAMDEAKLMAALDQLVGSGLVFRQGSVSGATYTFKHALVQGAAYESMLISQRQRLHARIASVLEKQFPEMAEASPEVLAHHYAEAGLDEAAIRWWCRAGQRAVARSSNGEAIASLKTALALLDKNGSRATAQDVELDILIALASSMSAVHGYASPETRRIVMRAREVCGKIDDIDRIIPALYSVWSTFIGCAEYNKAREITLELESLTKNDPASRCKFLTYFMFGYEYLALGKFARAVAYLQRSSDFYKKDLHYNISFQLTEHVGECNNAWIGFTHFFLGNHDKTKKYMKKGLEELKQSNHINSIGIAMFYDAFLFAEYELYGDAMKSSDNLIRFCDEQSLPLWRAGGIIVKGTTMSRLADHENGIALIRQGLADWKSTGAEFQLPQLYLYLAQAYLSANRIDEGLDVVRTGHEQAIGTGEHMFSAELHRTEGELLGAGKRDDMEGAERCFQRGLELARQQQSKTFELRAAKSLARIWAENGENQRAHELLSPIYGWFTEGLDTQELKDAKILLDRLC